MCGVTNSFIETPDVSYSPNTNLEGWDGFILNGTGDISYECDTDRWREAYRGWDRKPLC